MPTGTAAERNNKIALIEIMPFLSTLLAGIARAIRHAVIMSFADEALMIFQQLGCFLPVIAKLHSKLQGSFSARVLLLGAWGSRGVA